jgi:hypothetical protein
MDDRLPDILDQCLARIADGATVGECLAAYPAQQAELELPLRAAAHLRELPRPALPAVARAGLETQLLALAAARRAASPASTLPQAPRPAPGLDAILARILRALGYPGSARQPWLRLAAALAAVVLVLALGAGALAAARGIATMLRPQPTPTAVPSPVAPFTSVVVDGAIQQIAQEGWVVDGRTVIISSTTTIEGRPALGATAHVRGVAIANAGLLAHSIVVEQPPAPTVTLAPTATLAPAVTLTPTAVLSPTLAPAPAPTALPAQPAPADEGGGIVGDPKQQCQGQQRGRDDKKCDPKPHEEKKPPKPKEPKK